MTTSSLHHLRFLLALPHSVRMSYTVFVMKRTNHSCFVSVSYVHFIRQNSQTLSVKKLNRHINHENGWRPTNEEINEWTLDSRFEGPICCLRSASAAACELFLISPSLHGRRNWEELSQWVKRLCRLVCWWKSVDGLFQHCRTASDRWRKVWENMNS